MNYHPILKYILIISLGLSMLNCADEEIYNINESQQSYESRDHKNPNQKPFNYNNPYESMGLLHNEILSSYLELENPPEDLEGIAVKVQQLISEQSQVTGTYQVAMPDLIELQAILENPESSLIHIINDSNLSSEGKTSVSDFFDALLLMSDKEFDSILAYIIDYEADVLNDDHLKAAEKQVILTVTSILRHSFFYEKGRDDDDWVTSVGNIAAAVKGSLSNGLNAVQHALIAGLVQMAQD